MRSSAAILLASIASAFAYQVTAPGDTQGWTTVGPNYLTWVRVNTDPLNFTAVLTNQNQAVMPQGPQVLNALVDGTMGSIVCNPPSGGWPQGSGFRVNLAADAQHLDTLLAQSNQFNINSSTSSTGSTTKTATTSISVTNAVTPTTGAASTTSSDTSTTPTSKSAAILGMKVETGFMTAVAAFAAFITTHF
ncbi:GPI-anchored small secreted protein [Suillus placidus]|uniref:GPI-anchored small secreted protein n=1 Tax=Suillus placidus TaxID=48579 RepID=A0A9P7D8M0_9AGAM|nr:GPI-anchored small secreted protein [Suillus placidus]